MYVRGLGMLYVSSATWKLGCAVLSRSKIGIIPQIAEKRYCQQPFRLLCRIWVLHLTVVISQQYALTWT